MASYKIGEVFYSAYVEEGKVSISSHILRTIRGAKAYFIEKNDITWGKRSKKNGDYGWIDPIDSMYRYTFQVDGQVKFSLSRSISGALRNALAAERRRLKIYSGDSEAIENIQKNIDALLRRAVREVREKRKKKTGL